MVSSTSSNFSNNPLNNGMSFLSSSSNNYNQVTGLASGMDTGAMVQKLMMAESQPMFKLQQQEQWNEWKQSAFRDVNKEVLDLQNNLGDLKLQSTFNQMTTASTDSTVATASAAGTPGSNQYVLTNVKLAQPGTGASVVFNTNLDSGTAVGSDFNFTVNGSQIQVSSTDMMTDVAQKINNVTDQTGVRAVYFSGDKSLTLISTTTGSSSDIQVTNVGSNSIGIGAGEITNGTNTFTTGTAAAGTDTVDGQVTINGIQHNISSNNFSYDGMTFQLNADTAANAQVTITNKPDVDTIYKTISDWVDKYNKVVGDMNSRLNEKRDLKYPPLLQYQKDAMSDKDITLWTNKAKTGLLQNNDILQNTLYQVSSALDDPVQDGSSYNTLSSIGITSDPDYINKPGQLDIDETKLKDAITNHLSDVEKLFTTTYSTGNYADNTTNNKQVYDNSGVADRLYDILGNTINNIISQAGATGAITDNSIIGQNISNLKSQISDWQTRLTTIQQNYTKQFTAMETAMNNLNQQSGYLANLTGG